jgi:hypothetical protein
LLQAGFMLDWFSTLKMGVIDPLKIRFTCGLHGAVSQKMATSTKLFETDWQLIRNDSIRNA